MATPAIQTLLSDAQQVLNLNSLSEVRSTMAAALANANVGTPLNPNLTTQQLWDEFYLIVRQPESDIESIITNQLMKFLFAPPAPGGVGADGQVIFNDGGVLAGDPQFLWNKTTNLLTVTGSATITGDLTVASSILKVSGGNVGINTASPTNTAGYKTLEIVGTGVNTGGMIRMKSSDASVSSYDFVDNNGRGIFALSNHNLRFGCNDIEQYRIQPLGIFTWYDGAGGTRMTLNSTGLGVGVVPGGGTGNSKISIVGGATYDGNFDIIGNFTSSATPSAAKGVLLGYNNTTNNGIISAAYGGGTEGLQFWTHNGSSWGSRMELTATGNVGVGVTPSAWGAGYKALQLGSSQSTALMGSGNQTELTTNAFFDSAWKYQGAGTVAASRYSQQSGVHYWYTAAAGAANSAITWSQAMTLDASGRLLLGTASGPSYDGGLFYVYNNGNNAAVMRTDSANYCLILQTGNGSNTGTAVAFRYGATSVGSITTTGSGTSYTTTSDYRLKESVQPLTGGLARVNALKPSIYKWKADGSNGEGFIAHELAEVVPAAVTGEKDAVNEDGSIKTQSVDLSRVVPILVAAIKELTARVQTLEAK